MIKNGPKSTSWPYRRRQPAPRRRSFDRYHIRKHLSEAIDEIRRVEAKQHKQLLKGTRYLWLKRPANLTARQQDLLDELLHQPLVVAALTESPAPAAVSARTEGDRLAVRYEPRGRQDSRKLRTASALSRAASRWSSHASSPSR